MKNLFIVLYLTLNLSGFTQGESYYINGTRGNSNGNLLLVNYEENSHILNNAYTFKDSVYQLNPKGSQIIPLNYMPLSDSKIDSLNTWQRLNYGNVSENTADSIQVNQKWYAIKFHFDDDRFVGGMPNRVNKTIWVAGLGTIYSSNNYLFNHELMMLCHKDSIKQIRLEAVYKHLEKTNLWFNWTKMTTLTTTYSFTTCLNNLKSSWLEAGAALKLVSTKSTIKNNMVTYDVTLINTRYTNYVLPDYYQISPAKAIIYSSDNTTTEWDLMDSHYGKHFKRVNKPYYIQSGQTQSFTLNIPLRTGAGQTLNYHGFQIYSKRTFFNWILSEEIIHDGHRYEIYNHREIFY